MPSSRTLTIQYPADKQQVPQNQPFQVTGIATDKEYQNRPPSTPASLGKRRTGRSSSAAQQPEQRRRDLVLRPRRNLDHLYRPADGRQLHRVGPPPDISVRPTLGGIREEG